MGAQIGVLQPAETHLAGGLLARAFAADPILTYYLASPRRRKFALPAFFRSILAECVSNRHVYTARVDGIIRGVAAWLPPAPSSPGLAARTRAGVERAVVRALFPGGSRDLFGGFAATEALHPHEPHWYLAFVGIEPDFQGGGIGSTLLGPVLSAADETRTLCYLETPFPRTHVFYQRLGFTIASESHPFRGAPPLWTMVRRPAPA